MDGGSCVAGAERVHLPVGGLSGDAVVVTTWAGLSE